MISVIVPVLNGENELPDQLDALGRQLYDGAWELLVADNGSADRTGQLLRDWAERLPQLRVVDASARRGPAAARNIALEVAKGDFIAFADHDDIVAPGWLSGMASALLTDHVVAGPTSYAFREGDGTDTQAVPTGPCADPTQDYDFLPGFQTANLGVSKAAILAVGGFDEKLLLGEDFDLCWRLQLAGYVIRFHPEIRIWKRMRETAGSQAQQAFSYGVAQVRLYKKFRDKGLRRDWRRCARKYAWLLSHVPLLPLPHVRRTWVRVAGKTIGRLWGSLRLRVLYP